MQNTSMTGKEFGDKGYDYFSLGDVECGDLVVVNTKNGLRIGVVSNKLTHSPYACQYIVQKIDMEEYENKRRMYEKQQDDKAYLDLQIVKQAEINKYKELLESSDALTQKTAKEYIDSLIKM